MAVSFHVGNLPNQSVQHALEMGRRSEELGYDGIWVPDSLFHIINGVSFFFFFFN